MAAREGLKRLSLSSGKQQAPVVQTLDSAIHRRNHYPADSVIDFRNIYPLDSAIQHLNNGGQLQKRQVLDHA